MRKISLALFFILFALHATGQIHYQVINANDSGPGSLRQAALDANASPGADVISFDGNFHIMLNSEILITENVNIVGNGKELTIIDGGSATRVFRINSTTQVALSSLTIQNGLAIGSGGAAITSNANVEIYNVAFLGNTATVTDDNNAYGGAISLVNTTSSIRHCHFEGNKVLKTISGTGTAAGGAVSAAGTGSTSITNSTFISNSSAMNGGALYSSSPLTVVHCNFNGNKASYDGDVSAYNMAGGSGGAIAATEMLTLTGALTFLNNGAAGSGGAIYKNATGAFVTDGVTTLTVTGNKAGIGSINAALGGGIYTIAPLALTSANNATITDNVVYGSGGGIAASAALTLDNVNPISNNSATLGGGGINVVGALVLNNMTISGNKAGYNPDTRTYNLSSSGSGGGGVQAAGAVTLAGNIIFQRDTTAGYGGAFYWASTGSTNSFTTSQLTSLLVSENAAVQLAYSSGGGIYAKGDMVIANVPVTISNNFSNTNGGGIYSSATINFSNVRITNNVALQSGGGVFSSAAAPSFTLNGSFVGYNVSGGKGAGIYSDGPVTLLNDSIAENKAGYNAVSGAFSGDNSGGGLYANSDLTLQGAVVFDKNMAAANGGALFINATGAFTTTDLTALVVSRNVAVNGFAGGIYSATAFSIRNGTITNNTAALQAGGIYSATALTLEGCTISGNKAGYNIGTGTFAGSFSGGGLYASDALTLIGSFLFEDNSASGSGGAIWKNNLGAFSTVAATSVSFNQNTAINGSGGAVHSGASFSAQGWNISNNSAGTTGGGLNTTTGVTLNLSGGTISGNKAKNNGGGTYANGALLISDITVSGNKAGYNSTDQTGSGGGIYAGSDFTMSGANVIDGNTAAANGGGIYKANGTFTTGGLTTLSVSGNKTFYGHGGGMYTTAALALSTSTGNAIQMDNNRAANEGGGIYTTQRLNLNGVNVTNNYSAAVGSSSSNIGGGGICSKNSTDTLILTNVSISNNTAFADGGGIVYRHLTLKNVTISNNRAGYDLDAGTASTAVRGHGGGIACLYAGASVVTLKDTVTVESNSAKGDGGGMYMSCDGNVTIVNELKSLTVNRNNAGGDGGGIVFSGSSYEANSVFELWAKNHAAITNNIAKGQGGGIYSNNSRPTVTLDGVTITNNFAGKYGGGLHIIGSKSLTLSNSVISNNKAGYNDVTQTYSTAGGGGGAYISVPLILKGSIAIQNNMAGKDGGGLYRSYNIPLTTDELTSFTVSQNKAGLSGSASVGGGIYIAVPVTLTTANNVAIVDNEVTGTGGGIYTTAALTLDSIQPMTGNIASSHGGAIYTNAPLVLKNMTIASNKAGYNGTAYAGINNGGGIYASNALTLQGNMTFRDNTASGNGGGIYKSGSIELSATGVDTLTITGNTALSTGSTTGGGGIFITGSLLSLTNGRTIINNNTSTAKAGAIYANNGLALSNATLTGNKAAFAGGAIYIYAGTTTITNSDFSGNISKSEAGAVYAESTGSGVPLTLQNTTISNNKAGYDYTATPPSYNTNTSYGGGVYAGNALTLIADITFENNTSSGSGGAIYKNTTGAFTTDGLTSFVINRNTTIGSTTANGGGIYTGAPLSLTRSNTVPITITNNSARGNGGGIYSQGALTLNNITISNNKAGFDGAAYTTTTATGFGGGLYTAGLLTLKDTIVIEKNTAAINGGGMYVNSGINTDNTASLSIINNATMVVPSGSGYGGGGIFFGQGNTNITLGKPGATTNISSNVSAREGGGIFFGSGATSTITLQNVILTNNTSTGAASGGGMHLKSGSGTLSLILSNDTISNNKGGWNTDNTPGTGWGGGIQADQGIINIDLRGTVVFDGNQAGGSGGAIAHNLISNATGNITGSSLTLLKMTNNIAYGASGGGGIYTNKANIDLPNATISNNISKGPGGGIQANSNTIAISLSNATISGNIAQTNGGGISTLGALALANSSVSNNKAGYDASTKLYSGTASGGGIYATNALTLSGIVAFQNDTTATHGGGIYYSGTNLTADALTSLNIAGCRADAVTTSSGKGGGIYFGAGNFSLGQSGKVNIIGNTAYQGGGIFTSASLNLQNATLSGNTARNTGGGIITDKATLTLTNDTISSNRAGWDYTTSAYVSTGNGGGVAVENANSALVLKGAIVVENNTAGNTGGGICYNYSNTGFTAGTELTALTVRGNTSLGFGGGIYTYSPLTLNAPTQYTISNNKAGTNGGGIYAKSVSLDLTNILIANNSAGGSGGGIHADLSSPVRVANSSVIGNKAITQGGGIYAHNGAMTLVNDTISQNKAASGGGVAAINALMLEGALIFERDTAATANGGAILKSAINSITTTNLNSLKINQCVAATSGGAIYTSAPLLLSGTNRYMLTGNEAGTDGGAIYAGNILTIDSLAILENTAGNNGGAIYKTTGSTMVVRASTLARNSAANGGGIYTATNSPSELNAITNSTFSQNRATTGNGGAIYSSGASANASVAITLSTFNGNTASTGNAIYYTSPGSKKLNGSIVYGNGSGGSEINNTTALDASYNIVRNQTLPGTTNLNLADNLAGDIFTTTSGNVATLENNGGPTPTLNIKRGGYAQNFIPIVVTNSWGTFASDQTGNTRIVGCKTDAGAVEIQTPDDPASATLRNSTNVCYGGLLNPDTLIVSTINIKDTVYYSDRAYSQKITTIPVTVTTQRNIYVKFISNNNCEILDSLGLNVIPKPTLTLANQTMATCSGSTINLTATTTNASTTLWTGYSSTGTATGETTNTLAYTSTPRASDTTFFIYVTAQGNSPCNTIKDSVQLTLYAKPVVTVTSPAATCGPSTIDIAGSASGAATYKYYADNAGTIGTELGSTIFTGAQVTSYWVIGTSAQGCNSDAVMGTVTIKAKPVITVTSPVAVCEPTTIDVAGSASGATTYKYYADNAGSVGAELGSTIFTGAQITNYWVIGTSAQGCSSDAVMGTVTIKAKPVITVTSPVAVCEPSTIDVTGSATGAATHKYYADNSGSVGAELGSTIFTGAQVTSYWVIGTSAQGCSSDAVMGTVTIKAKPIISVTSPAAVCEPSTIDVTGSATGAATYKYYADNSGSVGAELGSTIFTGAQVTSYWVIGTSAQGCSSDAVMGTVTIKAKPVITVTSPAAICEPTTIDVAGSASGAATYKYYADNAGSVGAELGSTIFTGAQITNYWVIGTSAQGCSSDAVMGTVTIKAKPVITVTSPTAVCEPTTVDVAGSASGAVTYKYYADNAGSVGAELGSTIFTGAQITNYWVIGTSAQGCSSDAVMGTVTIKAKPVITVTSPAAVCEPSTVDVAGTATGAATYKYYTDNAGSVGAELGSTIFTGAQTTNYWVIGTSAQGCSSDAVMGTVTIKAKPAITVTSPIAVCEPTTVDVAGSATGAATYKYYADNAGSVGAELGSTIFTGAQTTNYWVIGTSAQGCSSDAVMGTVTIKAKPAITVTSPIAVCEPTTVDVAGSATGAATYKYYADNAGSVGAELGSTIFTGAQTTNYWVIGTSAQGCSSDAVMGTVTIKAKPIISVTSPAAVCEPSTVDVAGSATGAATYKYYADNAGSVGAELGSTIFTGAQTTNYWVIGTSTQGCSSDAVMGTVTIKAKPVITVTSPAAVCEPSTIDVIGSARGAATYKYYADNSGSVGAELGSTIFTGAQVTSYWVVGTSAQGCNSDAVMGTITIKAKPVITVTSPTSVCEPSTIDIAGSASGAATYKYYADNAGSVGAELGSTIFTGAQTTNYWVIGTSAQGCSSDAVMGTVTIKAKPAITVTSPIAVCEPTTVDVAGSATGAATYKYYADNAGSVGAELGSTIFTGAQTTNYWVIGTSAQGCSSDAVMGTVTIKAKPAITVTSPIAVCEPTTVDVAGSATGAATYKYYADNAGSVGAELGSTIFTGAQVTSYWVIGTSTQGCSSDAVMGTVTINVLPVPTITGASSVCANANNVSYSTESAMSGYQWVVSGGTITSGENTNSIMVSWGAAGTGNVSVSYTNSNGCMAAAPASQAVTINTQPVPTISGASTVWSSSIQSYNTEASMSAYVWTVTGGTITSGQGTESITVSWGAAGAGTVTVSYANSNGCTPAAPTTTAITIQQSGLTLTLSGNQVLEGGASVTATVCLSEGAIAPAGGLLVSLSTASTVAATEYELSGGGITSDKLPASITIPAGERCISFNIAAIADNVLEGTEQLTVTANIAGFTPDEKTLDIIDQTLGDIVVIQEGDASEPSTNTSFKISFKADGVYCTKDVRVSYSLSGTAVEGVDYASLTPHTVIIPATSHSVQVPITVLNNYIVEGTRTVNIVLEAVEKMP